MTRSLARASHFRASMRAGCVMVNLPTAGTDYHVPFGGMTYRAHKAIMRRYGRMIARESRLHFERKSKPALRYNSRFGGTYTSATFIAMMGLIDSCDDLEPDDRVSVFSYGSGSCAEFYSTRLGPRAREVVAAAKVAGVSEAGTVATPLLATLS